MNQKISTESVRSAPIALAVVLLVTLGLLALRVHAEETVATVQSDDAQQRMQDRVQEQRDIFKEAQSERQETLEEARGEMKQVREDATEELQAFRDEKREEMSLLVEEQKSEFETERAKRLELFRTVLDTKKTELQERVQEHKEERETRQTEYKARLSLSTQLHLGQYIERIVLRMDTALGRLEQIAERIGTRIEKKEADGIDLADAKVELNNTYVLIQDAHELIALIGAVSTDALTSETPEEEVHRVRDAVKLAKDAIVSIHNALSETVQLIKIGVAEEESVDTEVNDESNEEGVTE